MNDCQHDNFCLAPGIGVDNDRADMDVERKKGRKDFRRANRERGTERDTLVLL